MYGFICILIAEDAAIARKAIGIPDILLLHFRDLLNFLYSSNVNVCFCSLDLLE